MGEYQLYEFQAIDRPLTEEEQQAVSSLSSRVEPHPRRATFVYYHSDFRGDPEKVLARYYDAMLYMANWGSRQLMFRFPAGLLDEQEVALYAVQTRFETPIALSHVDGYTLLNVQFNPEGGGEWLDGVGSLDRLVALREDLLRRDYRFLYLAWLKAVQERVVKKDTLEPPVPPGLRALTPALDTFVEIFDGDGALIALAAEVSGETAAVSEDDVRRGIASLPATEKDEFLLRLARGEPQLTIALNRRLSTLPGAPAGGRRRTAGELLAVRKALREERRRQREAEAETKRLAELEALAQREEEAWGDVEAFVQTYQANDYDRATILLARLKELAVHQGREALFHARAARLAEEYKSRHSFLDRLRTAGLIPGEPSGRYWSVTRQLTRVEEKEEDEFDEGEFDEDEFGEDEFGDEDEFDDEEELEDEG